MAAKVKKSAAKAAPEHKELFKYASALAEVVALKIDLFNEIREAYVKKDKKKLTLLIKRITEISRLVKIVHSSRKKIWFEEFKPAGWEVVDGRFWRTSDQIAEHKREA